MRDCRGGERTHDRDRGGDSRAHTRSLSALAYITVHASKRNLNDLVARRVVPGPLYLARSRVTLQKAARGRTEIV